MFNPKVFVAEFIGTFALVFVGAAAGLYQVGLLGIAFAYGLTLAVFVYAFGYISGTHINPAVTLGLVVNGNVKLSEAVVYWVAQLSGASLAAFLLKTFITLVVSDPSAVTAIATTGALVAGHPYSAMWLEALLTFFLVNTILHTSVDGKVGQSSGLAIGLTFAIGILAGGPLSGASMNPARSFGPAIFASTVTPGTLDFQNPMFYLIYFVGPFVGAVLAVLLYQFFKYEFVSSEMEVEDDEDEDEMEPVVVEEPVAKPKPARKPVTRKTTKK